MAYITMFSSLSRVEEEDFCIDSKVLCMGAHPLCRCIEPARVTPD